MFIKDHLLRLNPDNRADCDTIYKKFQELDIQCRNDEAYCVDRIKQAPARSTTDRSLIVDIDIKFPKKPRIEIIRGSQSGYQIRLVDDVDIDPSDPPHPRGDPIPAHSAPNSPLDSPQAHPSRQLTPIEEIQVVQDVNRQQDRAVSRHNTAEAQDAAKVSQTPYHHTVLYNSADFNSNRTYPIDRTICRPSTRASPSSPQMSVVLPICFPSPAKERMHLRLMGATAPEMISTVVKMRAEAARRVQEGCSGGHHRRRSVVIVVLLA